MTEGILGSTENDFISGKHVLMQIVFLFIIYRDFG